MTEQERKLYERGKRVDEAIESATKGGFSIALNAEAKEARLFYQLVRANRRVESYLRRQ